MPVDYTYEAKFVRAVDGDTVELQVDLGFKIFAHWHFRVVGVDTPELMSRNPEERVKAQEARTYVEQRLSQADAVLVRSFKSDKFGRYLGDITYSLGNQWYNLTKDLISTGHAKPYDGGKRSASPETELHSDI